MSISATQIETFLHDEDLEDLINIGAPADEYASEAAAIYAILSGMTDEDASLDTIVLAISNVWAQSFDLDQNAVNAREAGFRRLAARIKFSQ